MRAYLLDINVLLALVWEDHAHHGAAHRWFAAHQAHGWATCAVTQLGFVRLSSHPKFSSAPVTPAQALEALRRMVALGGHAFFAEPPSGALLAENGETHAAIEEVFARVLGHGGVTDGYLALVARVNGGKLASFDRPLARLFPKDAELLEA